MNTQTELRKQMHDQVDRIDGSPISLDDVVGTAGTIRRRRRLATGTAVLAAAAVVVPTALFGGGILDDRTSPAPAEQEQTVEFHDAVIGPDAPEGPAPKLAYTDADRLVLPSGETIRTSQVYEGMVRTGDEYVAIWGQSGGEPMIEVLDESGELVDSVRAISGPVVAADGDFAAWIHPDGTVEVRRDDVAFPIGTVDAGQFPQVVGATSNGQCDDEPAGCRVFVNPQEEGSPVTIDFAGTVEPVAGDFTQVSAVSPEGVVAGRTSPLDGDMTKPVCSAVFDEQSGEQRFATCELTFNWSAGFSPDGDLLVGYDPQSDAGPRSLSVVDSQTGTTVSRIDLAKSLGNATTITGATWEDDKHLLVRTITPTAMSPGEYNLYRVGVDGSVEQLLEHDYDNGTMASPWLFVR